MVKGGFADGFVTVVTPERSEYTVVSSEDVLVLDNVAYASALNPRRKELEKVQTLDDLKDFHLVEYLGDGWAKKMLTAHDVKWVTSIPSALKMISVGRGDVIVDASQVIRYYRREMNLPDDIIELQPIFESVKFHLCVRKNSPFAARIAEFDQIIREMRFDGTLNRIYNKYQIDSRDAIR